jgi:DNA processing protein
VDDVFDELGGAQSPPTARQVANADGPPLSADEDVLITLIGFDALTPDDLAERSGWSPARLSALLLDLELAGRISRLPGGRVQRLIA